MSCLLDTCVISELVKSRPSRRVLGWLGEQNEMTLYLSVLTLGEIQKGVSHLEAGSRKNKLQVWVDQDLPQRFSGRVVSIDAAVARQWGVIAGEGLKRGQTIPVLDGLLAASAIATGMTLVTRNVPHFEQTGVSILDPWEG